MRCDLDPFFDCRFLWSLDELTGAEPYFIFADEQTDPFARTLIETARRGAKLAGVVGSPEELGGVDTPVFLDAPTWARRHSELIAAGVRGARSRPLLNFDSDPTGYWDFAKACGPELGSVIETRRLSPETMTALAAYLETWVGARALSGRLAPMPAFTVRDYASLASSHLPEIVRVLSVLSDDESRAAYTRVLFGDNEDLLGHFADKVFGPQQYMEIVKLKPGDVVVNCGVWRGWEIPYFICMTEGQGRIFNFDPNIVWNWTPYADFIQRFKGILDERSLILGSHDGFVEMPISNSNMVRSDEVGQIMAAAGVPTERYESRTLDSLADDGLFERIDYLKMDVEGGERDILQGGMAAIRRFRPKLAVAIYHEPQHFWEYPNMLIDQLEGYRYYVRQYGYSRFETLLYAIPEEDVESRSGREGLRPSAVRPVENGAGWATAYLRDKAERSLYYAGGKQLLTRVSGPSISAARLAPVANIEAAEVIAIFEHDGATTIVAQHPSETGNQLLVARSREPSHLEWVHSQGLSEEHRCVPAPGPEGRPGYAIVSIAEARCWLYAINAEDVEPLRAADLAVQAPILIQQTEGGLRVFGLEADRIVIHDSPGSGEGPRESILTISGDFAGFAYVRRGRPDAPAEQVVVLRDDDRITFVDGGGRVVAQWEDDERFVPTSTFIAGARPLTLSTSNPERS